MPNTKNVASDATDETAIAAEDTGAVTFADAELRGITSFEAAIAAVEGKFGSVADASEEIGSGFVMLDDKEKLIGETFIIVSFSFPQGDYRDDNGELSHFAVARLVTQRGDRYVITDGGHGIYSQLDEFAVRSGRAGGLLVRGGLRKSEYEYVNDKGITQPAVTYYLNV